MEIKKLEGQIDEILSRIHISERFRDWAIKYLKEEHKKEITSREAILRSQRKAYDGCLKKLDNLFQLKISPSNTDGNLLSDEEYAKRKTVLMKEKACLEAVLNDAAGRAERWLNAAEEAFDFACHARYWFANGTPEQKSQILQALGSNLILKGKKLRIYLRKPLTWIEEVSRGVPEIRAGFEPEKFGLNKGEIEQLYSKNPTLRGALDEVRTWIMDNLEDIYIPSFRKKLSAAA